MTAAAVGKPPPLEVAPTPQRVINNLGQPSNTTHTNTTKPKNPQYKPIPMKQVRYLHGKPRIWKEEEVTQMIINEDLQFAVIGNLPIGVWRTRSKGD
ncbi:hypothetical protein KY290_008010 [Solanum tuberosum]|uniref:Integrase core domain containing protein n=1 Tax=Solanum tuberosum TaxID=4113 RepID=A0ABQ7W769_SOLTU|nr:hypothetical protein KY290_008010 [Solanum tuberosum]